MTPTWHEHADRDALAQALAAFVATGLTDALRTRPDTTLAVSGGRTPERFFAALSRRPVAWGRVSVILVDERWVPESSPRSNARLVRQQLLQGQAAAARFVPLHRDGLTPAAATGELERVVAGLPQPFAISVLGMGTDGHTASFFPGTAQLASCLDPDDLHAVAAIDAAGIDEPRMTLTLHALLRSRVIALHIEGDEKRRVYERASRPGPATELPVRAVLTQSRVPVHVFWSP